MRSAVLSFIVVAAVSVVSFTCSSNNGGNNNPPPPPPLLKSFITSTSGTGDLSTWGDAVSAGSVTGLVAADTVCQARAQAAGLSGTFRAWMSDSQDDAYCRMHDLKGKKAANCGQATLPASAGPWVRTDGEPFAEIISKLTGSSTVLTPARYDENGMETASRWFYTGTDETGESISARVCSDWTSTGANSVTGTSEQTFNLWSEASNTDCQNPYPILCMQTGSGRSLTYQTTGKKVFKTSVAGTGKLSSWPDALASGQTGTLAGDAICNARASIAGLTGTYKAWLSAGAINAKDRLTSNGPWMRVDGVKLASSKADLTDGFLLTNIIVDEFGAYSANTTWTGTGQDGMGMGSDCGGWDDNSAGSSGIIGRADIYGIWSNWMPITCDMTGYVSGLYCFED